jgi:hypothetical protein
MYVRGYLQGSENGRVVTIGNQRSFLMPKTVRTFPIHNRKIARIDGHWSHLLCQNTASTVEVVHSLVKRI